MASYRKRKDHWQVQLCVKGVRRAATFTTKREAQAWAAREETTLREDAAGQIPNRPFRDLLERYSREVSSKMHIPAQDEHSFWFNVNTDSGQM